MGTPCVGNAPWSSGVDGEAVSARLGACAGEQGRNAGRAFSAGPWPEPWATPPGAAEGKDGRGGSCWGPAAHPAPAPRRALPAGPRAPLRPSRPRAPVPTFRRPVHPGDMPSANGTRVHRARWLSPSARREPGGAWGGGRGAPRAGAHIAHVSPASRASRSESGEHDPKGGQRQLGVLATRGPCTARRQVGEAAAP